MVGPGARGVRPFQDVHPLLRAGEGVGIREAGERKKEEGGERREEEIVGVPREGWVGDRWSNA